MIMVSSSPTLFGVSYGQACLLPPLWVDENPHHMALTMLFSHWCPVHILSVLRRPFRFSRPSNPLTWINRWCCKFGYCVSALFLLHRINNPLTLLPLSLFCLIFVSIIDMALSTWPPMICHPSTAISIHHNNGGSTQLKLGDGIPEGHGMTYMSRTRGDTMKLHNLLLSSLSHQCIGKDEERIGNVVFVYCRVVECNSFGGVDENG